MKTTECKRCDNNVLYAKGLCSSCYPNKLNYILKKDNPLKPSQIRFNTTCIYDKLKRKNKLKRMREKNGKEKRKN